MHIKMFFLIGLLLITTDVFSQDPNFYIFLCFGQSNMEGQGSIETQDKTVDSRFQIMEAVNCSNLGRSKGTWYSATPPLCRCYTGLSPADYFGRTMVENLSSNIKVGVVNVSVAGCKIELFDKNNYQTYVSSITEDWLKNIINEYGGNPYAHLVEIAKLAQRDGVIKGILLHQGESNTGDSQWPSKVKRVYDNLMTDLGLDPAKVPLLAGEVVHANQGGICAGVNSIIAKLPQTIPNSYVISSSACTDAADNLHFNSAGYREIGKRYAVKMLSLLGIELTAVQETGSLLTDDYELKQNFPNPFNPETKISYSVPRSSYVKLKIYNLLGQEVTILFEGENSPGNYEATFDGSKLTSGVYFYTLMIKESSSTSKQVFIQSKKMTLIK